jgi:hypothetical protein
MGQPRLRSSIRNQSSHDFGVAFDGQQESASRRVRGASTLLPVAQSREGQTKCFSKFLLRHVETLPQHLDARCAAHLCKLRRRERPSIGIRPGSSLNRITFYDIDSRPVQGDFTDREKVLYFREIKWDIAYFSRSFSRAHVSVDITGCSPDEASRKVRDALRPALLKDRSEASGRASPRGSIRRPVG